MVKQKKKSKGPQHRNSNFQLKNGNGVTSSRKDDRHETSRSEKARPASEAGGAKSLLTGISGSISSAANSITKMFKHE
jgi:hypothetical protein